MMPPLMDRHPTQHLSFTYNLVDHLTSYVFADSLEMIDSVTHEVMRGGSMKESGRGGSLLGRQYSTTGREDGSDGESQSTFRKLAVKLAQLKMYKELSTMVTAATSLHRYEDAIFGSLLLPDKGSLLDLLRCSGRYAEGASLALSLGKKDDSERILEEWKRNEQRGMSQ